MNLKNHIAKNIIYILRELQNENQNQNNKTTTKNNNKKEQLRDLYIYLAILVVIIIAIIGGYALYRKFIEKKALQEIEREYEIMLMNLLNSNSSQVSSSQDDRRPRSFNNINPNHLHNFENEVGHQNVYNSLDYNPEERMENIRKKFGNTLVIKCLIKKQIEEIPYTKNFAEEYGDNCTICMENFIENRIISKTPCEHIFHKECFDKYLKEIQKKDKLLCPNCNQNLLINKKFLKLRVKTKKIEIKKNIINKKEIKESELNLENDLKNRNSVMTNRNEDNLSVNSNNEIIFIKKKHKKDKNKISEDKKINNLKEKSEGNIYNPLQIKIKKIDVDSKTDKDTNLYFNDNHEDKKDDNKLQKRNIVIVNNLEKKNTSLKNTLNSHESKSKFHKKRKLKLNDVNSERGIDLSKKSNAFFLPSTKQENNNNNNS